MSEKCKIFVSACLMGEPVRYHGGHEKITFDLLETWKEQGRLIVLCPEMLAGFSVPRVPSEIQGGQGRDVLDKNAKVIKKDGRDVTDQFILGATRTLERIVNENVRFALLKSNSPSCGPNMIYDGNFSGNKVSGQGVTAALLKKMGIQVFDEKEIDKLINAVNLYDSLSDGDA